jgi:hypothetical protein
LAPLNLTTQACMDDSESLTDLGSLVELKRGYEQVCTSNYGPVSWDNLLGSDIYRYRVCPFLHLRQAVAELIGFAFFD